MLLASLGDGVNVDRFGSRGIMGFVVFFRSVAWPVVVDGL